MQYKTLLLTAVTSTCLLATAFGAGRAPATRAGSTPTKPATSTPARSENAAALYQKIVADYLAGEWIALEEDLNTSHAPDLAAMPKDQKDDVAYIKQALIDGRGTIDGNGWWDSIKAGKTASTRPTGNVGGGALAVTAGRGALFKIPLWGRSITFAFDKDLQSAVQMSTMGNSNILTLNWPVADMDSKDQAEHGFTKGDLGDLTVWSVVAQADVMQSFSADKLKTVTQEEPAKLPNYMSFRGNITGAYYGTPRARRWAIFLSMDAYQNKNQKEQNFIARKPLGAMVIAEIVGHPAKYPSIHLPANVREASAEATFASALMGIMEKTTLTLAEDKTLRESIKEFATPNQGSVFSTGKITLPNKQTMMFDPAADTDTAAKRNAWLVSQGKP